jgi:hypothetical protein
MQLGVSIATFNTKSAISWRLVLLMEKSGVSGENNRPVASHWQTLVWFKLALLVVIGADCTGSCKSSYHAITPRRPPSPFYAVWFICTLQNIYISNDNGSFLIYVVFFFFLVSPTSIRVTRRVSYKKQELHTLWLD